MKSSTKYKIDNETLLRLFARAGFSDIRNIKPLGAGEYNAVFSAEAGGKAYAIKIAPSSVVPTLTYENDMLATELEWYSRMAKNTDLRIPEIYYSDFSKEIIPANYFIMEKISGTPLFKVKSKTEKQAGIIETVKMAAQIHNIKNDKFGYTQNGLHGNWYTAIRAMTENLLADSKRKGKKGGNIIKLLGYIDKYKTVLKKAECCMVNFDAWPTNFIAAADGGIVWIDPERSFWGDRLADFNCFMTGLPLKKKTHMLDAYNSVAYEKIEITRETEVRHAVALAYLGLIMDVEKHYRYCLINRGWWRNVLGAWWMVGNAFKILGK